MESGSGVSGGTMEQIKILGIFEGHALLTTELFRTFSKNSSSVIQDELCYYLLSVLYGQGVK